MLKKILYFLLFLIIVVGIIGGYAFYNFGAAPSDEDKEKFTKLSYYKNSEFQSPLEILYLPEKVRNGPNDKWRFVDNSRFAPKDEIPMVKLEKSSFSEVPEDMALYWLGHSSLIMELDGKRIAFDPVLENAGPLPFIAPRFVPSPIKREKLPEFDYIILSHNHYDHLERQTVQEIKSGHFIVPLGVGAALRGWGIASDRITELGWDDSFIKDGLSITAVKGVHYSGRSPWDRNETLWNSYVVKSSDKNIFINGDTGYSNHFKEIGEKYGPFDFATIEMDGWNPAWPRTHLFIDEAVMAAKDLQVKKVLPVHWGVFELALHPWQESINMLSDEAKNANIELLTPIMGEKINPLTAKTEKWWQGLR